MIGKPKTIFLVWMAVFFLSFSFSVKASGQDMTGYIYSEDAGLISLNCTNTNSCDSIDYKVVSDGNGSLSGYGFSQDEGWINFNPDYGGLKINSDNSVSGWIFTEKLNWLRIDNTEIIFLADLQDEATSTENTINRGDLSSDGTMSMLNSLCGKFLTNSECQIINN